MTIKKMKYFETVCRTGSVTAAAEELYVSRSVISRAIKELEEEFGVVLFTRTRLGLALTESGKLLRNLFFEFTGAYSSIHERLRKLNENGENLTLTIGITASCGKRFYPRVFKEFNNAYPDVIFNVVEVSAFDSRDQVATGVLDFAFTPLPNPSGTPALIEELSLYTVETVFCAARGSRFASHNTVTPREVIDYPTAVLLTRMPLEWPFNVVLRTSQHLLIRNAIIDGIATAVLPRDMIKDWDGVVGISFEPPFFSQVKLIWNNGLPHSRAFDAFLDFIKKYDLRYL